MATKGLITPELWEEPAKAEVEPNQMRQSHSAKQGGTTGIKETRPWETI